MNKIIKYDNEAKDLVVKGIDTVANIVKTTVGPKGRNVLIREAVSAPIITNDGVTIAKSIHLKDNAEDAGAQLIIQAANKTNLVAGDGTTTTTILAQEMIHKYFDEYKEEHKDVNVVQIQKDMIKASEEISDYLKSIAIPVKDNEAIKRVATISSGSEITGKLIADAFANAGEFGSVIVEDSKTGKDHLDNIQGMKLANGTLSNYLLNDRINLKSEIVDAKVLITKDKIDSVTDILPILDTVVKEGLKLLIICNDIDFEPLNMILVNKAKGAPLNVSIIGLPGFGELRENLIEDICIATGATLMGRDIGRTFRDFDISMLGEVEEAIITPDDTVLKFKDVSSTGIDLKDEREVRVEEITGIMENIPEESDREQYKRRISNLISGISVIQVGGNSEIEIKDKKLRIEDAINSVKAAMEEGIVPGGGYSFLSAVINAPEREGTLGERIVYNSLESVTRQIAENAGFDGPMTVANCYNKQLGFNALTGEYENLVETGVINAAKVDRYGILNATSIASTVITMGGLIVDEPEKDQNVLQLSGPLPGMM